MFYRDYTLLCRSKQELQHLPAIELDRLNKQAGARDMDSGNCI